MKYAIDRNVSWHGTRSDAVQKLHDLADEVQDQESYAEVMMTVQITLLRESEHVDDDDRSRAE